MTFTESTLFRDCALSGKKAGNKEVTAETYQAVWKALQAWVESQFLIKKGCHITGMCSLTWRRSGSSKEGLLRPAFVPVEAFIKSNNIQWRGLCPAPNELVSCEDINFAKIAIRFSQDLNKDMVFTCSRHMFSKIGSAIATGTDVKIDFKVGTLFGKDRKIDFAFSSEFSRARCTPSQDMGDASATIAPQTSPSMPPGRGAVPAEATTKVDTMAVTARLTGAPAPLSFREVKERKASARQQKACLPGMCTCQVSTRRRRYVHLPGKHSPVQVCAPAR
ncbi:hypothetical protein CYMTET_46867 [Cymbomonas tetramitiformis]|uniref:CCDC81 HU domain-containing protein n=2 Tax=Cymbomonas tetramitiformis TaxID=36881 RepID=A0AAE0BVE9_9CHLO|nr:hypothetical protein CYMTET_46867 [Cymbomonas tetramitiformis]